MSALKKIAHRRWEEIRDLWVDYLPHIDMSVEFPEPTLWQLPSFKSMMQPALVEGARLEYIDGVRQSVFREVIFLVRKFSYCRMVGFSSTTGGFPTWGIIAAYDACFYGAKALCYLLGIINVSRDSKFFIDIFTPGTTKVGKNAVTRYDTLLVHKLDQRLTHQTLWSLLERLCNTLIIPEEGRSTRDELKAIDFDQISNYRNKLLYDGAMWFNIDNFAECDLTRRISNRRLYSSLVESPLDPEVPERYFGLAATLHKALVYLLGDIGTLAPAILHEVEAMSGWRTVVPAGHAA
jgi:hypothetical protein